MMTPGQDLGEVLLMKGLVSEEELCRCQSLHSGVMSGRVEMAAVRPSVVRSLPKHLTRRLGVLPVSVDHGRLLVAAATVPPADAFEEMKNFTGLAIDFQLVTRSNFNELSKLAW